jgi:hypothetical protein
MKSDVLFQALGLQTMQLATANSLELQVSIARLLGFEARSMASTSPQIRRMRIRSFSLSFGR